MLYGINMFLSFTFARSVLSTFKRKRAITKSFISHSPTLNLNLFREFTALLKILIECFDRIKAFN
jgi:hypothetical protein